MPPKVHYAGIGYRHKIPVIRAWDRNSLDNDPLLKLLQATQASANAGRGCIQFG